MIPVASRSGDTVIRRDQQLIDTRKKCLTFSFLWLEIQGFTLASNPLTSAVYPDVFCHDLVIRLFHLHKCLQHIFVGCGRVPPHCGRSRHLYKEMSTLERNTYNFRQSDHNLLFAKIFREFNTTV